MPTSTWAPTCAPTVPSARATSRSSCRGRTAFRTSASTSTLWMTNKTPVGTYRGPGRFETDFFRERLLDMVAADLEIDRVEFRRRNLIPAAAMPYPFPTIVPFEIEGRGRQRRLSHEPRPLPRRIRLGGEIEARGAVDRRPSSRPRGRLLPRRRRGGPEGNREARDRRRRRGDGVHGLLGGRPGRRNGVRPDRGRRPRNADRAHHQRLPRLDGLCERRLWRLSFALDRDGRLGPARRGEESPRGDPRRSGEALELRALRCRDRRGPRRRSGRAERDLCGVRRHLGGGHLPQQEAHLHLWRRTPPM